MIKLDENYTMTPDAYCWVLKYEGLKNKIVKGELKEVKDIRIMYPSTAKKALELYLDERLKDSNSKSIQDLLRAINKVEEIISNLKIKYNYGTIS